MTDDVIFRSYRKHHHKTAGNQALVWRLLYSKLGSEGSMIISFKDRGNSIRGKRFLAKTFNPSPWKNNLLISSKFFTRTWVKLFTTSCKWYKAPENLLSFSRQVKISYACLLSERVCLVMWDRQSNFNFASFWGASFLS